MRGSANVGGRFTSVIEQRPVMDERSKGHPPQPQPEHRPSRRRATRTASSPRTPHRAAALETSGDGPCSPYTYTRSPMGSLSNIPDFDAVLKRVLLRVREVSNTVASDLLLPQDKLGIPKLLCLDQNKWIDLARAEYGHRDGTKYAAALADVRAAVTRGTLIVPITATNLAEVAEPRNVERRTRLAKFMVDLSGNRSLVSPDTVLRVEFRRAVELLFLKKPDAAPVPRRKLVRKGMMFAFGKEPSIQTGDPQLDELVERALLEPEVSVLTLVHATDEQAMAQMRAMDEKARLVADRARISRHKRDAQRLVELKNLLMHRGTVATALRQVLAK